MKNKKPNSYFSSNSNILSPSTKNLNPIDECPETDDIIKKLENLNFSSDGKSFETPFISREKKSKNFNPNSNKYISIPNLINDNIIDDFPKDLKSIKDEELSDYDLIINSLIKKETKEEKNQNDVYEVLIKEKINRICMLIQKHNINQKCFYKMNNLVTDINVQNASNYRRFDGILDVVLELLDKIREEHEIKEELINKLNNISLNKEDYEKKILEIKKELIYKEREIETLLEKNKSYNDKNKDNSFSSQNLLFEMKNVKKENQFLFDKILNYKAQIKKICYEYINLYNKYKICLNGKNNHDEKDKNIYLIKENPINFSLKYSLNKKYNNHLNNNSSINSMIKKLVNDLISLLLDINKMIFKFDFSIVKMNKNNNLKTPLNDIKDLTSNLDVNYLLNKNNYKIFSKYLLCNMDIIYNKIINSNKNNIPITTNSYFKSPKDFKRTSDEKKKINGKTMSLNNSRVNQTINLYVPEKMSGSRNLKYYMSIRKKCDKEKKKNMTRNSTSRNGLSFLNFYSDADLEGNSLIKKSNSKINKKLSYTINIDKSKKTINYNNQNGAKKI